MSRIYRHHRCRKCRYSADGMAPGSRCPECGNPHFIYARRGPTVRNQFSTQPTYRRLKRGVLFACAAPSAVVVLRGVELCLSILESAIGGSSLLTKLQNMLSIQATGPPLAILSAPVWSAGWFLITGALATPKLRMTTLTVRLISATIALWVVARSLNIAVVLPAGADLWCDLALAVMFFLLGLATCRLCIDVRARARRQSGVTFLVAMSALMVAFSFVATLVLLGPRHDAPDLYKSDGYIRQEGLIWIMAAISASVAITRCSRRRTARSSSRRKARKIASL